MTKEKRLFRILFLASIFLLLLNDLYLKYEYHNYLTGKISDFAGLFAFPYFFSCFFPKRTKLIYILTAFLFVFWKSEFSQTFFDFAHSNGLGINRTVDYSDLIALIILPISYRYLNADFRQLVQPNRILKPVIIGICCFAFVATSVPDATGEIDYKSDYEIDVQTTLDIVQESNLFLRSTQNGKYLTSLHIPENKASIEILLNITEKENGVLTIKLDSILYYNVQGKTNIITGGVDQDDIESIEKMTLDDFEKIFVEQKIKPLQKN